MPTEPIQLAIANFEIALLPIGIVLAIRLVARREQRSRWFRTSQMTLWPVTLTEFALFLLLVFFCGLLLQAGTRLALGPTIAHARDRAGLEVFAYGAAVHGGALVGWLLFPAVRRRLYWEYGALPPAPPATTSLPWSRVVLLAAGTLVMALPVLEAVSFGWTSLLRKIGLPNEPQDLIAIFSNTRSPLVIAGMFLVACVVAPLNEELIFRAGLFRFCRQKLGRNWALLISGCLFGALHGNWAGFLPLALLGAGLALAYEATGDIRVTVVAHGLFNLNTILVVLSGLTQQP